MGVQNINVAQAKQILDGGSDAVYIDVRTEGEFQNGHVPNAVNIPVVWPDPATRQMKPNPDFVKVVAAHYSKDKKIIVGCQMGGRSLKAAEILGEAGFQDVSNMQGGFGGARDPMGRVVAPGWATSGYPVEMEASKGSTYEGLKQGK